MEKSMLLLPFSSHRGLNDKLAFFKYVLTHDDEVAPAYGNHLLGGYFEKAVSGLKVLPENY